MRENNQAAGKTWTYAYDSGGNILSKTEYAYTTGSLGTAVRTIPYGYDDATWSDLLTNIGGQSLTADEIGNLLSDGTWAYTWQHSRQLAGMSKAGTSIAYGYDSDGRHITKTVNDTTYNYHYLSDQLVELTWGSNKLHFTYDSVGPASVNYNGTIYNYIKNAQGDVVGLVDFNGTKVVEYIYDAWGNHLSTFGTMASTLGKYNPLRYRGYVYDTETGLYYLQSRYYNPTWGRFINADDISVLSESTDKATWDKNLFAYCDNNPVNRADDNGEYWHFIVGAVVGGFMGAATAFASGETDLISVLSATIAGAVGGALAASGAGRLIQAAGSAVISMTSNVIGQINEAQSDINKRFDVVDMLVDGAVGFATGYAGNNGASYGNTAGIKAVTKRAQKRIVSSGLKKGISYYTKNAHNKGGTFVLTSLKKSLKITAVGNAILAIKNRISSLFSRR